MGKVKKNFYLGLNEIDVVMDQAKQVLSKTYENKEELLDCYREIQNITVIDYKKYKAAFGLIDKVLEIDKCTTNENVFFKKGIAKFDNKMEKLLYENKLTEVELNQVKQDLSDNFAYYQTVVDKIKSAIDWHRYAFTHSTFLEAPVSSYVFDTESDKKNEYLVKGYDPVSTRKEDIFVFIENTKALLTRYYASLSIIDKLIQTNKKYGQDSVEQVMTPTNEEKKQNTPNLASEIIYGKKYNQISLEHIVDIGQLTIEMDKVEAKEAYGVLVDCLNKKYRELLIGNFELKKEKTGIIKSKILRVNNDFIGLNDSNINEYGISDETIKKITFMGLSTFGGGIIFSIAHENGIKHLMFLGIVSLSIGLVSFFKNIGTMALAMFLEDMDSLEQYFQRIVYDYKDEIIDASEFKSKLYNAFAILEKRYDALQLEAKDDDHVKRR
ncbi:MAG: hypothetical protein PHN72_06185 [Bacilli bacterium]|nr:hypothetical protein [Bacilli bacterium]